MAFGVPSFAPEILRRVRLTDAMKAKKLKEALQQMSEEGVVQVFRPRDGAPALVGVVGPLQLERHAKSALHDLLPRHDEPQQDRQQQREGLERDVTEGPDRPHADGASSGTPFDRRASTRE